MGTRDGRLPVWVVVCAVVLFIVHALNYLYFFVDDEAIPYVYAQNLLHGKGLIYNTLEGRVEGYSDFLHVWVATFILAGVRALHLAKVNVFFVGKAWSLGCGTAIVVLVWALLRRMRVERTAGMTALAFLVLAPPLAVWSCSSLETVPFALTVTVLLAALISDADRWAAVASILLILERIDGFVYAGVLIGAFLFTAHPRRRRAMLAQIALPVGLAFVAYHAWRGWYFRDLVPAPLEAKILYKLKPHVNLMVKAPDASYLRQFIDVYGWPAVTALAVAAAAAVRRGGVARRLVAAAVPLLIYVSLVGDWMFGFRFFVPLMPLLAIVIAIVVGDLGRRWPRPAVALAVLSTGYLGVVAAQFVDSYKKSEKIDTFLHSPSRDLHRFFWPYYSLYEAARNLMPPGEIVAYNQAGFVPFMLDLNNIDDLGICSRFYADLPTTDLYFTEVGRYAPLTNRRTLGASESFLLYEHARFVLSRTDILLRANGNGIPPTLFGGYYELLQFDAEGQNAIYRRTDKPAGDYETSPQAFAENVAHVSYVRGASVNGVTIAPSDYQTRLQFLRDQTSEFAFTGTLTIAVEFAQRDELVREVSLENIRSSESSTLKVALIAGDGRVVHQASFQLERRQGKEIESVAPAGTTASRLILELSSLTRGEGHAWLTDVRVHGQTPELERYIAQRLRFPAPQRPQPAR